MALGASGIGEQMQGADVRYRFVSRHMACCAGASVSSVDCGANFRAVAGVAVQAIVFVDINDDAVANVADNTFWGSLDVIVQRIGVTKIYPMTGFAGGLGARNDLAGRDCRALCWISA